jgi:hypothetical protein
MKLWDLPWIFNPQRLKNLFPLDKGDMGGRRDSSKD